MLVTLEMLTHQTQRVHVRPAKQARTKDLLDLPRVHLVRRVLRLLLPAEQVLPIVLVKMAITETPALLVERVYVLLTRIKIQLKTQIVKVAPKIPKPLLGLRKRVIARVKHQAIAKIMTIPTVCLLRRIAQPQALEQVQ